MARKKAERKPNPILDTKTSELLFGGGDDISIEKMLSMIDGTVSIDDLVQSPLSDINTINERLTTIGELVANPDARRKLRAIADTFGIKYDDFYKKVQEYVETGRADAYRKQRVTGELVKLIAYIATTAENLPVSLGQVQFKSKTLEESASVFNTMMSESNSPRAFFEYLIELNYKIKAIVAESAEKEKKAQSWFSDEIEGITYVQLKELADINELTKFKQHVPSAQAVAAAVAPYLGQAEIAVKEKYCEPIIVPREENCLIIRNGRNKNWRDPVPNHTYLDSAHMIEVLEGVNNGGKTFDMKKLFYIAVAALSGSWVPADYARVSVRDKIILRQKGKGDIISAMQQDCRNVKEATPPDGEYWLIGLDEIFTSTERRGGRALLYGLINSVLDQDHSLLITSSHYLGLNSAFESDERVIFNHFPFERKKVKKKTEIVFPYTKQHGPLKDIKYALEVAATQGFDAKVIEYAARRLAERNSA